LRSTGGRSKQGSQNPPKKEGKAEKKGGVIMKKIPALGVREKKNRGKKKGYWYKNKTCRKGR